MKPARSDIYRPVGVPAVETRLERFRQMNTWVTGRGGGWITSLPGDIAVRFECLPRSSLPDELRAAGYVLRSLGEGERILSAESGSNPFHDWYGTLTNPRECCERASSRQSLP
jgi:hypothetical protein